MTNKIFRSMFLMASLVLLASLVLVMGLLYEYFGLLQRRQLEGQTALAAQGVAREGRDFFTGLDSNGYRLTWVDRDGAVLYDSETDASRMENHADREEIREALASGSGQSQRYSATLAEQTFYQARRLPDGTVIRVSATQHSVFSLLLGLLKPILTVLGIAVILSALLARSLARRIVSPLNRLNLDRPLENEAAYEELSPLLTRIERQHRQINRQMEELERKNDEFSAVIDNMNEGLLLLNGQGQVLSINYAAARLFKVSGDGRGRDILAIDRSLAMQELVKGALAGQPGERTIELADSLYQLHASPVRSGNLVRGVALLAFDATEQALAERQRREFSANVSHELKTPLQTIMGSAELIENGLVKPEDLPRFAGRIRGEAARLVTLIDDIIRLSQLDEGTELPREAVDLLEVAEEAAAALAAEAFHNQVALTVEGEPARVNGVRRLLYEIVYNLADNAVKYNVPRGSATIRVAREQKGVSLTVADTGIGIPPEDQQRVFQRFYRVDKSHSKATGGTGLGLSIVKHAAQYHQAAVELHSRPGQGTRVRLLFPDQAPGRSGK